MSPRIEAICEALVILGVVGLLYVAGVTIIKAAQCSHNHTVCERHG